MEVEVELQGKQEVLSYNLVFSKREREANVFKIHLLDRVLMKENMKFST